MFVYRRHRAAPRHPIGLAMIAGGTPTWRNRPRHGPRAGADSEQACSQLVLIAVPMFIFAANVMNAGALSEPFYALARAPGAVPRGLAHVNVLASVIFAGHERQRVATRSTRNGRDRDDEQERATAGLRRRGERGSATIGPIIPPSIPMVLLRARLRPRRWGAVCFIGGIVPGLLMAVAMMLVIV